MFHKNKRQDACKHDSIYFGAQAHLEEFIEKLISILSFVFVKPA